MIVRSGAAWAVRHTLQAKRATAVCYHDPQPERLREHLRFLRDRYSIVPLEDVVAWHAGRIRDLPPRPLVVTLDDGWSGNARLARVFQDEGVVPTIFVCTRIVGTHRRFWWEGLSSEETQMLKTLPEAERSARRASMDHSESGEPLQPSAMSRAELAEVLHWADVQSHTRHHPILPRCDESCAWDEIAGSRNDLRAITEASVYALAYPNGDHSERETGMVRLAGYDCAFTVEPGFITRRCDPYRMRRIAVRDDASTIELASKLSGIHSLVRGVATALRLTK